MRYSTVAEQIEDYLNRLADLRSRAHAQSRDAYGVAIGQLRACDLINERQWREALDRPVEGR